MRSIKTNKRYVKGITDYHHRLKTLKNYEKILRVTLNKKNKFYCSGFYKTQDPAKPDICLGYYESRFLKYTHTSKKLGNNQEDLKSFGYIIGRELNTKLTQNILDDIVIILDLGRRKKLLFESFIKGILVSLDPKFKDQFKVCESFKELDSFEVNKNVQFITSGKQSKTASKGH